MTQWIECCCMIADPGKQNTVLTNCPIIFLLSVKSLCYDGNYHGSLDRLATIFPFIYPRFKNHNCYCFFGNTRIKSTIIGNSQSVLRWNGGCLSKGVSDLHSAI